MQIYNIKSININGRNSDLEFDRDSVNLYINSNTVNKFYSNKCRIPFEDFNIKSINRQIMMIICDRVMIGITELKDEITIHPISNFKKNRFDVKIKFEVIDLNISESIINGFRLIYKDNLLIGYYDIDNHYVSKYNFGTYDEDEVLERLKKDIENRNLESKIREEFNRSFKDLNDRLIEKYGVKVDVDDVSILSIDDNDTLLGSFRY